MADRAVQARKHTLLSGTGTTAVDGVKGAATSTWNWGRIGAVALAVGGMALGIVTGIGPVTSTIFGAAGLVAGGFAGATIGGMMGVVFGGIKGTAHGLDRVDSEHKAHQVLRTQETALGVQAQQAAVQAQAIQNLQMLQAMEAQAMSADVPSMRVASAGMEPETRIEPSAHMQNAVPGMKEAANQNEPDMDEMLKLLSEASHGDKVNAGQAMAADAEQTR